MNLREQITSKQVTLSIFQYLVGSGILSLPRAATEETRNHDAWISVLVAGILIMGIVYVVTKVSMMFPERTFFQYSQEVFGKWIGRLLSLVFSGYFLFQAGYQSRIMAEVIHMHLLTNTPKSVLMIVFMAVGTYLVVGGVNALARFCEFVSPITLLLVLVVLLLALSNVEIDNLRPVLVDGVMPIAKGIMSVALPYTGAESVLILYAFMKKSDHAVRATVVGIGIATVMYTLVTMVTIGTLTAAETQTLLLPVMDMAKEISFPGGFFERFELLLLVFWVLFMYTTYTYSQYFASLGLSQLFNKKLTPFVYAVLPLIYGIAVYPSDINAAYEMGRKMAVFGIGLVILLPLLIWIFVKIRKVKYAPQA